MTALCVVCFVGLSISLGFVEVDSKVRLSSHKFADNGVECNVV